jgi:hypothetical protein
MTGLLWHTVRRAGLRATDTFILTSRGRQGSFSPENSGRPLLPKPASTPKFSSFVVGRRPVRNCLLSSVSRKGHQGQTPLLELAALLVNPATRRHAHF